MQQLPNEIILYIVTYLDFKSIARLSQTCYDMFILCNFIPDFAIVKSIANTHTNGAFVELFKEDIYLHRNALRLYYAILTHSQHIIDYFICDLNENKLTSLIFILSKTEPYHVLNYIANRYGFPLIRSGNIIIKDPIHISCSRGLLYTSCCAIASHYKNDALYDQLKN